MSDLEQKIITEAHDQLAEILTEKGDRIYTFEDSEVMISDEGHAIIRATSRVLERELAKVIDGGLYS